MLSIQKALLLSASVFLVQACSGGGGGDSDGETTPTAPVVSPSDYSVTASETVVTFSPEYQSITTEPLEITINYSGDDLIAGYAPGAEAAAWLSFELKDKTTTAATFVLTVNDNIIKDYSENLYKTAFRISAGKTSGTTANLVHQEIDVSMLLAKKVSFSGVKGTTEIASQTSTIITNTTDTWSVSNNAEWLNSELIVSDGTISVKNTPIANALALTNSTFNTSAKLVNTTTQEEYTIPVEVGLEDMYLFDDQQAISFVSTPNIDTTTLIVNIGTNAILGENDYPFFTVTNIPNWLEVEVFDTQIRVTADPSKVVNGLTADDKITIEALPGVEGAINDVIPVSIFKSESEIAEFDIATTDTSESAVFAYPAGPYVYVGAGNKVYKYNQFTGVLASTITAAPEADTLTNIIIHPKGTSLIAQTSDGSSPANVNHYKVNLDDNTYTKIENKETTANPLAYTSVGGRHFVITEALEFADENLQLLNKTTNIPFTPTSISISEFSNTIFAVNDTEGGSTINRFVLAVNDATDDKVKTFLTHTSPVIEGGISDLAVTSNEQDIYIVSDSTEWVSFNSSVNGSEAFANKGLLETDSGILVLDDADIIIDIYTPEASDIITHSVTVDRGNNPHFMRTVEFAPSDYKTYVYNYDRTAAAGEELSTHSFVANSTSQIPEAPYTQSFAPNNNFTVLFNPTDSEIKVAQAPFIPLNIEGTYKIEYTKNVNAFVIYTVKLLNIASDWIIFETNGTVADSDWLSTLIKPETQELDVTITPGELSSGVYQKELYIYDTANKVTQRIKAELTVPEA